MTAKNLPPVEYLRKRLRYEPETGKLFWRDCEGLHNGWRKKWVGKEAFFGDDKKGYKAGEIDHRRFFAHRVIWAIHYGAWPSGVIDHIDGNPKNNLIENLRDVSMAINMKNQKIKKTNTSGVCGVSWHKQTSKWRARISIGKSKGKHLGLFDTFEDAVLARNDASRQLGYSDRHGK